MRLIFNNTMIGNGMMLGWAQFGIRITDIIESSEQITIYISVPESSFQINANNEEMSGMRLARRFKEMLKDFGVKRLIVKAKVRIGEHWTRSSASTEEVAMKRQLYGSQY